MNFGTESSFGFGAFGGPGATIVGANNGLSVSTINPTLLVLGQDVSQAGNPAALLSHREIPMATFRMNWINGSTVLSDTQNAGTGLKLEVYNSFTAAPAKALAFFSATTSGTGSTFGILGNVSSAGTPSGTIFRANRNNIVCWSINAGGGNMLWADALNANGAGYASMNPSVYVNKPLQSNNAVCFQIIATWSMNNAVDPAQVRDIQIASTVSLPATATILYSAIELGGSLAQNASSNGIIRGIWYHPSVNAPLPVNHVALQTETGDVWLCTADPGLANNTGKVGIRVIDPFLPGQVPSAYLEIGGSDGTAESAPLKFDGGTLMVTPEPGAWEYNGNLFFTPGVSRLSVLLGVDSGTAPALHATPAFTSYYGGNTNALGDPNKWAAVNIGGITYKVPLYT